jgi:L-fucose dehydrogenase
MDLALEGKIIIVSGGARGIGEGITNLLAAEGAIPVIIGRSEENNIALVKAIQMQGYQADQVVAELTEPAACENAINKIVAKFGKIDGLVNFAKK